MTNMHFEPNPESPIGCQIAFYDPDTGREIFGVIASDGFKVEVSADDINELPGVGVYIAEPEDVIFGFLHGIADITTLEEGFRATEEVFPTFMSRHEAP